MIKVTVTREEALRRWNAAKEVKRRMAEEMEEMFRKNSSEEPVVAECTVW